MRIGLFLIYQPFKKNFSLTQEGLGRYFAMLINSFLKENHEITLACPVWSKQLLWNLMLDYNIDPNKVKWLIPDYIPYYLRLYYFMSNYFEGGINTQKEYKKSYIERLYGKIVSKILVLLKYLLVSNSFINFCLLCFLSICMYIASSILGFITFIFLFLKKVFYKLVGQFTTVDLSFKKIFFSYVKKFKKILKFRFQLTQDITKIAAKKVVKKINEETKEKMDIWFSPIAFFSEFSNINGTKVMCVPDLVTDDFAFNFAKNYSSTVTHRNGDIRDSITKTSYFITYSDFVKENVLINKFNINPDRIKVITMFFENILPYIDVAEYFKNNNYEDPTKKMARNILWEIPFVNAAEISSYLGFFNWFDFEYLFYPSQYRNHKNILNLIKAYEYLLKREEINCKLILTCYFSEEIKEYIFKNDLQNDVLAFFGVSNKILSALYKCSSLVVNPTLSEGGLPFTFTEGMSFNVPSVMSRISQTEAWFCKENLDDCLFDPYDYRDIADKILYGLKNKEDLVNRQYPLFKKLTDRTASGQAGREYIEAFKYFIECDKNNN